MLKKLNNKGMTLVEVVVCFALVTIVLVSMYNTISVYKTKQNIESYKETVTTYKNLLTKEIQDDLITKGLISANISDTAPTNEIYTVTMNFKDGSSKILEITRIKSDISYEGDYNNETFAYYGDMDRDGELEYEDNDPSNPGYDEGEDYNLMVTCYNNPACDSTSKKIMGYTTARDIWNIDEYRKICSESEYAAAEPDCIATAGHSKYLEGEGLIPNSVEITETVEANKSDEFLIKYGEAGSLTEYPFPNLGSTTSGTNTLYDLKINNVYLSTDNNILSIYIGFYHPELLRRYAIDIVCPINYS